MSIDLNQSGFFKIFYNWLLFLNQVVNENDPQQNFNVENDIQIMKLDDETGISETYQNINGADVLKLETTPTNKNLENLSVDIKPTLDVATSPR